MLIPGKYYHIYNRANGDENLFRTDENFRFFLEKYKLYISPWVDTFAYCLMPNHFHFFVKVKNIEELKKLTSSSSNFSKVPNFGKVGSEEELSLFISKQFSKLFSSYTQALNKQIDRTGSLFQKNFRRKEVSHIKYFQNLILYIHSNPVHHGFTSELRSWPHSSYHTIVSSFPTLLNREVVIEWFDSIQNFEYCHQQTVDLRSINELSFD
ncbi:transposase [Reichenbachiella sp.]